MTEQARSQPHQAMGVSAHLGVMASNLPGEQRLGAPHLGMLAPSLVDLTFEKPGLARWRHGIVGGRGPREILGKAWRLARQGSAMVAEKARAFVPDQIDRLRGPSPALLRAESGDDPMPGARSVAIFVQFSPSGALSRMVQRQLEIYKELGFAVILVSNSPFFPEESWRTARRIAAFVVHRRNRHLDFGAWKDLAPLALERWPDMNELLLVNDSVLGPIRPLEPHLAAMRQAGAGFFGMLESLQGGAHLQSWFVLAAGKKPVADLLDFLDTLRLSRSKRTIIQRGEQRMARTMHQAGNRVAALFSYSRIVDHALEDEAARAYLERLMPRLFEGRDTDTVRNILMVRPLNPAHHFWTVLLENSQFPFLKTELIRKNPGRLPEVAHWPNLLPPGGPASLEELRLHIAKLEANS